MADNKKPKAKANLRFNVDKKKGYDLIHTYDADTDEYYGGSTTEDRSDHGPRERRKEDRRKADERTTNIRRQLSDRRNTYNFEDRLNSFSNRLGEKFKSMLDPLDREEREISRRGGNPNRPYKEPSIVKLRPKIKSRKGGLLGLGLAVLSAGMAAKEAYAKSEEKD